ncbi:hypothetical protein Rhopal_007331-T1 [Rhodotorula paludigena]|uniref:Uncharacterized protein n=1 Tax=Rhodotorula paludigena TaxID=86838 RepID=A0AAV5GY32_9BASI|nr:hypothetical protein Rhopal_007331-T1 [Rhodotorula paludigena]
MQKRQWQIPQAEGFLHPQCYYVDLSIFTCYPESNTTLVEDDYSLLIWNLAQPSFISRGAVDVHLYDADTQEVVVSYRNESNAQGMIGIVPDDPWWPEQQSAQEWFGANAQNRSRPYFFVVVPAGEQLTGGEVHGATFTAIQTAAPTSLSAQLAALTSSSQSAASSASSASVASLSSASVASSLSAAGTASSPSGTSTNRDRNGNLQDESSSGGSSLPNWGIALIVVLGFLALLGGAIAVFFCLGRARRRRRAEDAAAAHARGGASSGDLTDAHGSEDPILLGGAASAGTRGSRASSRAAPPVGAAAAGYGAKEQQGEKQPTLHGDADASGGLSQSDAARMAEAFRAALRKPEYEAALAAGGVGAAARPGAGPSPTGSPEGDASGGSGESRDGNGVGRGIMEEELRSEGKSMRSVEGGGKRWGGGAGGRTG